MSLKNKETGEPPRPVEQLAARAAEKEREYENTLLKKSLAESIQQVADEFSQLKKKYEGLLTEYENSLQQEKKNRSDWQNEQRENRNNWQKSQSESLNKLLSANQQLQSSIDQKVQDMSGELERRTVKKVEEVTEKANRKITESMREFELAAKNAEMEMKYKKDKLMKALGREQSKISDEYRAAFGVGVGWKILMAAGSVAWILILLLHYVFKVV